MHPKLKTKHNPNGGHFHNKETMPMIISRRIAISHTPLHKITAKLTVRFRRVLCFPMLNWRRAIPLVSKVPCTVTIKKERDASWTLALFLLHCESADLFFWRLLWAGLPDASSTLTGPLRPPPLHVMRSTCAQNRAVEKKSACAFFHWRKYAVALTPDCQIASLNLAEGR